MLVLVIALTVLPVMGLNIGLGKSLDKIHEFEDMK